MTTDSKSAAPPKDAAAAPTPANKTKAADPSAKLKQLQKTVRDFWMHSEDKFKEVWKVLEAEGKTKFARACVQACNAMTPQADLLFPEVTVESIVEDEEHVSQMFYYQYADDCIDRDRQLVQDLAETGQLQGPPETALAIRQLGLLTCLTRLIDVYEAIWTKGVKEKEAALSEDLKQALVDAAQSVLYNKCVLCKNAATAACSRCQKIKYCSKECQKSHWKSHKVWCDSLAAADADAGLSEEEKKAKALRDKLELAKKKARDKQVELKAGGKVRNR